MTGEGDHDRLLGLGYVLGSRAGRERYEQLVEATKDSGEATRRAPNDRRATEDVLGGGKRLAVRLVRASPSFLSATVGWPTASSSRRAWSPACSARRSCASRARWC